MLIYLAGPMRHYPDFNRAAFDKVSKRLRAAGHTVFSPAENDVDLFGNKMKKKNRKGDENTLAKELGIETKALRRKVFASDMKWICEEADAVALLPGWKKSTGATAERALGRALGHEIIYIPKSWIK